MMKKNKKGLLSEIIIITCIIIFIIMILSTYFGWKCHITDYFSKDKYCAKVYLSNWSNAPVSYVIRSHIQDGIDNNNRLLAETLRKEQEAKQQACYDKGYNINLTFDPIIDYNLSCVKLNYINDHLIDYVVDGGHIRGHYSGFFSHGDVEGYSYIIKRGLFEDKLTKDIFYHVDCNNQTSGEIVNYYNEKEFIGYYLDKCL